MAETAGFTNLIAILYLISAGLFIFALKGMTKVRSARGGNQMAALAMLIAIVATVMEIGVVDYRFILIGLIIGTAIGAFIAIRVEMTEMPEMVGLLNGCGGAASVLVALSTLWAAVINTTDSFTAATVLGGAPAFTIILSILVGGVTFSGSFVAFLKLRGMWKLDNPVILPGRHVINAVLLLASLGLGYYFAFIVQHGETIEIYAIIVIVLSLLLGIGLVIPIGGADMPVVISLLNSYSGIAAAMTGFVIGNAMLIIAGALVGASGLILTQIMCVAMNRSLANVIFGGFGAVEEGSAASGAARDYGPVRSGGPEEAAMLLDAASRVMIVPGYGLAVAQAQHIVKELADVLAKRDIKTEYAIHPVAGRMPGHMNVLLAEADVPYEQLLEMERANPEMKNVDVAIVLGANDVVNPAADDPGSPIAGMPIIAVQDAQSIIVIKRSLSPGFAGIKNRLFEDPKTMMLFMDAKEALQGVVAELKDMK